MNNINPIYDAFIIGGGISGAAVANNLAGKGFYVALCDENDLSGEASSHSNKLFQCGLEHLENLDLSHVSNALQERDRLCSEAHHLMQAIDMVIPDAPAVRSSLKIKAGTLLYGWLLRSKTCPKPHSEVINDTLYSAPLRDSTSKATLCREYLVNDSRLVIENLLGAQRNHCELLPKTKVISGCRSKGVWKLKLQDSINGDQITISTRCIVNAAGAWAPTVLKQALGCETRCEQPLQKESYIAVPKFYEGTHGYMLQLPKRQFLSILPYANEFCLVGPISTPSTCATHSESVARTESDQLIEQLNNHFNINYTEANICWSFSSVKPATDDAHQPIHMLDLQCSDGLSPVISVFSGHITTHRILAEQVYECIHPYLPTQHAPKRDHKLPGGEFDENGYHGLVALLGTQYFWLPKNLINRYCSTYGSRAKLLLEGAINLQSLGKEVLPGLYEKELYWLIENEWVTSPEDVLWRRTKLGIGVTAKQSIQLQSWFDCHYQHLSAVSKKTILVHSNCKAS